LTQAVSPSKSNWCALAYDAESDEVVLFGGEGVGLSDETWGYNYTSNTWADLSPNPRPTQRWFHAMAYDAQSDRIVLFGGEITGGVHDDQTWIFHLNANTWTSASPGARPSGRSYHAMTYDSRSDRVLLFGGDVPGLSDEMWAYDFDANRWVPLTRPSAPRTLVAAAGDSRVDLSWLPPGSSGGVPITNYRIYRGTVSGTLTLLAEIGNVLTYADSAVANGLTYYYAVTAVTAAGEGPSSNERLATVGPGPDTINPTIAITSPADSAILTSTSVTVSGTASDDVALSKVELSRDGTNWSPAFGTTPWSGTLTIIEGDNTIYARATDTSGNSKTVSVTVTLVIGPSNGTSRGGSFLDILASPSGIAMIALGTIAIVGVAWFVTKRRRGKGPES